MPKKSRKQQKSTHRARPGDKRGGQKSHKSAVHAPSGPAAGASPQRALYDDKQRILVVGDGDFSFSAALLRAHLGGCGTRLVCTSYDDRGLSIVSCLPHLAVACCRGLSLYFSLSLSLSLAHAHMITHTTGYVVRRDC